MDMGIVNAGMLEVYEEIEPELRELVEDVLLNRRPDATERLVDFGERLKAESAGAVAAEKEEEEWRKGDRRGAPLARAGEGHRRVHRRGHRGGARQARPPARRHRGAAHGRDERRRRPLRRREDVPAAGREVGARDEEGGRVPHALHGGGEGRDGRRGRGREDAGQDRPRHREGRRPRHRQEHRRRRARLQQLRGHRHGRHGPVREDPRARQAGEGRPHRPLRAHHAVARRDGARRARDGAPGVQAAAAHRRRDDEPRAHRGQDRALLQRAGRPRARREPRRPGDDEPPQRRGRAPRSWRSTAPTTSSSGARTSGRSGSSCRSRRRARTARRSPGAPRTSPQPLRHRACTCLDDVSPRDAARVHRLDAVLPHLGAEGRLPAHPRAREVRRARRESSSPRRTRSSTRSSRRSSSRRAGSTASSRRTRSGDDVELYADESRADVRSRASTSSASKRRARRTSPNRSLSRLRRARGDAASAITSAPSP